MTGINAETCILVESKQHGADKRFLDKLIAERGLLLGNNFEIRTQDLNDKQCSVEGVLDNLKYLSAGKDEVITTGKLKNLLLIIDADESASKRFKEIQKIIRNGDIFALPSKLGKIEKVKNKINFGVYLFPDNKNKGSLESLILSCARAQFANKRECIDQYIGCLSRNGIDNGMTINNVDKSRVRIIGATPDPDNYIQNLLNIVDFNSLKLAPLISFLNGIE